MFGKISGFICAVLALYFLLPPYEAPEKRATAGNANSAAYSDFSPFCSEDTLLVTSTESIAPNLWWITICRANDSGFIQFGFSGEELCPGDTVAVQHFRYTTITGSDTRALLIKRR